MVLIFWFDLLLWLVIDLILNLILIFLDHHRLLHFEAFFDSLLELLKLTVLFDHLIF